MQRIEALEEYNRAQRLGVRDYRERQRQANTPICLRWMNCWKKQIPKARYRLAPLKYRWIMW